MVAPSPGSGPWAGHKHLQNQSTLIKNRNNKNDKKKKTFPILCNKPRLCFKKWSYKVSDWHHLRERQRSQWKNLTVASLYTLSTRKVWSQKESGKISGWYSEINLPEIEDWGRNLNSLISLQMVALGAENQSYVFFGSMLPPHQGRGFLERDPTHWAPWNSVISKGQSHEGAEP